MPVSSPKKESKRKQSIEAALRYSGMAFQLAILIGLGAYIGQRLDARTAGERPWFTIAGVFLGLIIGFYVSLKDLLFPPDGEKERKRDGVRSEE